MFQQLKKIISFKLLNFQVFIRSRRFASFKLNSLQTNKTGTSSRLLSKMKAVRLREQAVDFFNVAIKAVTPKAMVLNALKMQGNRLFVGDRMYELNKNVHVVAFGKAVIGMVKTVEEIMGEHIVDGIASVPKGIQATLRMLGKWDFLPSVNSKVKIIEGGEFNLPDENSHRAALEIYESLKNYNENDIVLVLISGGGSALLPSPIPPITIQELHQVTQLLSKRGASIQELNTLRKHLELLKGGGLAKTAYPARVITLMLSDVVGNNIQFIASGPTTQDYTIPQQCLSLLDNLGLINQVPWSIIKVLNDRCNLSEFKKEAPWNGSLEHLKKVHVSPQTNLELIEDKFPAEQLLLKSNNSSLDFEHVQNYVIGSNLIALEAAIKYAESCGFSTFLLSTSITGDAGKRGQMFALLAEYVCRNWRCTNGLFDPGLTSVELKLMHLGISKVQLNEIRLLMDESPQKPLCIFAAGETTVNVGESSSSCNFTIDNDINIRNNRSKGELMADDSKIDNIAANDVESNMGKLLSTTSSSNNLNSEEDIRSSNNYNSSEIDMKQFLSNSTNQAQINNDREMDTDNNVSTKPTNILNSASHVTNDLVTNNNNYLQPHRNHITLPLSTTIISPSSSNPIPPPSSNPIPPPPSYNLIPPSSSNPIIGQSTYSFTSSSSSNLVSQQQQQLHIKGGRNQHMVLSTALTLEECLLSGLQEKYAIVFLSGGTDGQDGPTDAAGAMCDPDLARRARKANLDPFEYIRKFNSYEFFSKVDLGRNHLKTGLTGTNVMDIQILLIDKV